MTQPLASPPPLALTMGEPAGIGPELALKTWADRQSFKVPPFFLIASKKQMDKSNTDLGLNVRLQLISSPSQVPETFDRALPLFALHDECEASPGNPNPADAVCVIASIKKAVQLCKTGEVSGLVTNPIHKKNLYDGGFSFPGHTEFLAHLVNPNGHPPLAVMLLQGGGLRAVPVTIHIPLAEVPAAVTTDKIVATAKIVHQDLVRYFGIGSPRLAVAGLNPHAGENGTLGDEDIKIVEPAIAQLKSLGFDISGPLPADTMFHDKARSHYDVALCMYHDQALIPVKTLGFDTGVNITLGLGLIRTSPDHGTACDIAGQGIADTGSLVEALKTAQQMAAYDQMHSHNKVG